MDLRKDSQARQKRQDTLRNEYVGRISSAIKDLLEKKHLYQYITLGTDDLIPETRTDTGPPALDTNIKALEQTTFNKSWQIQRLEDVDRKYTEQFRPLSVVLPGVKMYCRICKGREAYNPSRGIDDRTAQTVTKATTAENQLIQDFVLFYQCQSCKGKDEVFLIRRIGPKLTLCGRAPIEYVEVPPIIPNDVKKYFSGAIVAHQSGQTLAGLFLLRTLVEQWVYAQVTNGLSAVQALEEYSTNLPVDFRARFPSLSDVYSVLSADLHGAKGSPETFDNEAGRIVKHFDARRVYEL